MIDIKNLTEDISQELSILNWRYPGHPVRNCLRAINYILLKERKWRKQIAAAKEKKLDSYPTLRSLDDYYNYFDCNKYDLYILNLVEQLGLRGAATQLKLSHTTISRILQRIKTTLVFKIRN